MSTGVVLLAAGSGQRFGQKIPKQLQRLKGEPLFVKSLRTFASLHSISEIVLVVSPRLLEKFKPLLKRFKLKKNIHVVGGGSFRGESVRNGLLGFQRPHTIVLVHDSARPLVDRATVKRVESATQRFGVALAAWPLPDTLKESGSKDLVKKTIPRKNLWLAQTPQGFQWKIALQCLLKPQADATDDVALAERKGHKVKIVLGSAENFKVTYPHDLKLANKLISRHPRMS